MTNTCVWCQNIYRGRRATYPHHQQSWKRGYCTGKGSHLHTVVIPVKTSCSHCDQHFESVAMLLEHLRTVFPLVRNAELGLDTVVRNDGSEATENETSSRCAGAAESRHSEANVANSVPLGFETRPGNSRATRGNLPYFAGEAGRTSDAGEQRSHGTLCVQVEGGTETTGRAARLWMGSDDDSNDQGPSTLRGRQTDGDGVHVQRELTGHSSAKHLLEPVQKTNSEGLHQVAVFSGLPDPAHLVPHHQSHEIEGSQREIRPSSSGGQRSGTSTDARRSAVQVGQQVLTSWIRPKMPSFVQLGTRVRGGQKLLTDWMRPKSRSAPTVPFAWVSATEHVSPIHEDGAEFFSSQESTPSASLPTLEHQFRLEDQ